MPKIDLEYGYCHFCQNLYELKDDFTEADFFNHFPRVHRVIVRNDYCSQSTQTEDEDKSVPMDSPRKDARLESCPEPMESQDLFKDSDDEEQGCNEGQDQRELKVIITKEEMYNLYKHLGSPKVYSVFTEKILTDLGLSIIPHRL